ncbi:hypothetical protein D3C83_161480 [compost metagenome]
MNDALSAAVTVVNNSISTADVKPSATLRGTMRALVYIPETIIVAASATPIQPSRR